MSEKLFVNIMNLQWMDDSTVKVHTEVYIRLLLLVCFSIGASENISF